MTEGDNAPPRGAWILPTTALIAGVIAAYVTSLTMWPRGHILIDLPPFVLDYFGSDSGTKLRFSRPPALWLVPIATVPFVLAMASRSLVDLRGLQLGLGAVVRALTLLSLAVALAEPTLLTPVRGKTIVFALDMSASVDDTQIDAATDLVRTALAAVQRETQSGIAREDRTRLKLVTYAEYARSPSLAGIAPDDLLLTRPDKALASRHADALALASALLDPDTDPSVVLITDGNGTLAERQALAAAIASLETQGVSVHTRSFPGQAAGDVAITAMHLPTELRVGTTIEVAIDLVASAPGRVRLALHQNGAPNELAASREVELRGGAQQIKLPARLNEVGALLLTARLDPSTIEPENNRITGNDLGAVAGEVQGRPRVLHVGSDSSAALVRALRADHLDVEDLKPGQLPTAAKAFEPYDLVIFSDVRASSISTARQRAVARYVREHGGGFMMIGGERSFGVGGWGGSAIEGILPVRFEGERQREEPTLALMLVIDKSGSMSSQDKLDLVKEASRVTARTLDPGDEIGVIAFDSRPHVLVRLQRASNRIRISSDIRRLTAGGGTNALPALREAYLQLSGSHALIRHVILLSDGQSPERGILSLLHDMREADITVSTVGVGAGAGKDLLSRIAERGRGRYYFSADGTDVPRIFSRETREISRNAIVEKQHYARVAKRVQALRGLDFERAPGLDGIVPIEPKPQSEVLLRTHQGDPLLVRGRRGLGRTLAFASDAKPRWASRWITWGGFPKLWSQLARDTMRQSKTVVGGATIRTRPAARPGTYEVSVDVEGSGGFANDLDGEIEVTDLARPEDDPLRSESVPLSLAAPGRYQATLRGLVGGQRLIRAQLYNSSSDPRRLVRAASTQISIPYPPELAPDQLAPRHAWLASLAANDSGQAPASITTVVETPGQARGRTRSTPMWPHILWILTLPLLITDLALRRVSLGRRCVTL